VTCLKPSEIIFKVTRTTFKVSNPTKFHEIVSLCNG
jgi:hypothetical protein